MIKLVDLFPLFINKVTKIHRVCYRCIIIYKSRSFLQKPWSSFFHALLFLISLFSSLPNGQLDNDEDVAKCPMHEEKEGWKDTCAWMEARASRISFSNKRWRKHTRKTTKNTTCWRKKAHQPDASNSNGLCPNRPLPFSEPTSLHWLAKPRHLTGRVAQNRASNTTYHVLKTPA